MSLDRRGQRIREPFVMPFCTKMRFTVTPVCPEFLNLARIHASTAVSSFALSHDERTVPTKLKRWLHQAITALSHEWPADACAPSETELSHQLTLTQRFTNLADQCSTASLS
jgi:hypothetical protein